MPHFQFSKAHVLLIDDEPEITAALAHCLGAAGYECRQATSAATANECIGREIPELVICDINLAGESGLELCEQLKRLPGMAQVPIMFLSGAQVPDVIRRAHAAGGVYYLRKPFDPQVLLELVEKALWMPQVVAGRMART